MLATRRITHAPEDSDEPKPTGETTTGANVAMKPNDPRRDRMDPETRRLEQLLDRHQEGRRPIAIAQSAPGREFFYAPGQILVGRGLADRDRLLERIKGIVGSDFTIDDSADGSFTLNVPEHVDIPWTTRALRTEFGAAVGPNHVFFGTPSRSLKPIGPATEGTMSDLRGTTRTGTAGAGITIAVLDTGIAKGHETWRDAVFPDLVVSAGSDYTTPGAVRVPGAEDLMDVRPHNGMLDWEAGHGTFIAGVIGQIAPGATVRAERVFASDGVGFEDRIAAAIRDASDADIINMSFGGYTQSDLPPIGLLDAIDDVPSCTVLVASAGNEGCGCRPCWPAALKRVLAVGAVDANGEAAWFTNFGFWVDACALGVDVLSSFFKFDGAVEADPTGNVQEFEYAAYWNGTSFAAPQLAAAIAAVAKPGQAQDAVRQVLATGTRIPGLGVRFAGGLV